MPDMKTTIYRNLLNYAVGRAIFCPFCDVILDSRKAVLVTDEESNSSAVVCAACWEKAKDHALAKLPNAEVMDGRELWKRSRSRG